MIKFTPIQDRVVILPVKSPEMTAGGIHLPASVKERPKEGTVIAAGKGSYSNTGVLHPVELQVGDTVLFSSYSGTEYKHEDEEYLIMRVGDILSKVIK